ncbi:unnamed protein product [Penicillium nalgiovense]|nr:unnamed protein product [Penicillium nalgiovense]
MFLRRGKCLSSPCFEVIRGVGIFKSCRHIYSHLMTYSVSCFSRISYKRISGYHFLFSSSSPAPLKDYRRGCSDCTTGPGEHVIVTGVWPACTTSILAYMQGTGSFLTLHISSCRLAGKTDAIE